MDSLASADFTFILTLLNAQLDNTDRQEKNQRATFYIIVSFPQEGSTFFFEQNNPNQQLQVQFQPQNRTND